MVSTEPSFSGGESSAGGISLPVFFMTCLESERPVSHKPGMLATASRWSRDDAEHPCHRVMRRQALLPPRAGGAKASHPAMRWCLLARGPLISYPQNLCITMWTELPREVKHVMQPRVCVGVRVLSPVVYLSRAEREVFPPPLAGNVVAVTRLRPVFLLLYNAASAILTRLSAILRAPTGIESRPHRPKLAVI